MIGSIIGWAIFGLIVGAIARLVVPGPQAFGILGTLLVGVVGSFIGGFLAYLLFGGDAVQSAGWIGSVLGAVIAIFLVQRSGRRIAP